MDIQFKKHTYIRILLITFMMLISSACAQQDQDTQNERSLLQTIHPPPAVVEKKEQNEINEVKNIMEAVYKSPEIYDVSVVKSGKEIIIAYKVKHLHRFKMKKIEKRVKKHVKQVVRDDTYIISSDYKIFLETVKLHTRMSDGTYNEKKVKEKFQSIVKLTKEET